MAGELGNKRAERLRVPAGEGRSELVVKNSVFAGVAAFASSVEESQQFVARCRVVHPDATHHVWAFRVGETLPAVIGFSDDGEPGGTAGRPTLAVLEGSGLSQTVVVVTRWFGGIKLGPGGLVRAYSAAARGALAELPVLELVLHRVITTTIDYTLYNPLLRALPSWHVQILDSDFADTVHLTLAIPCSHLEQAWQRVTDLCSGRVTLMRVDADERYLEEA